MKRPITILICSLIILSLFGQNNKSKCFALRVANKKYLSDTLLLQPLLHLQGFYVVTNGVYDFEINDKLFKYQRVFKITKDSIYAGYVFDSIPTLNFSLNDKICIWLNTCYDGRCGFPNYIKIKKHDYDYKIIESKQYCFLDSLKVCSNKNCEFKYPGYQYLIDHSNLVVIYQKDGEGFAMQGSTIIKIMKSK